MYLGFRGEGLLAAAAPAGAESGVADGSGADDGGGLRAAIPADEQVL